MPFFPSQKGQLSDEKAQLAAKSGGNTQPTVKQEQVMDCFDKWDVLKVLGTS